MNQRCFVLTKLLLLQEPSFLWQAKHDEVIILTFFHVFLRNIPKLHWASNEWAFERGYSTAGRCIQLHCNWMLLPAFRL